MGCKDEMPAWVSHLIWAVFAGVMLGTFGIPLLFGAGIPVLNEALAPYAEEINEAYDMAWDWTMKWWWVSTLGAVLLVFWKIPVVLALMAAEGMARSVRTLGMKWVLVIWAASGAVFGTWHYHNDGLAHALFHLLLSAVFYVVFLAVGGRAKHCPDCSTGQ